MTFLTEVEHGLQKAIACSHEILGKTALSNILAVKVWEWLPLIIIEGANLSTALRLKLFEKVYYALKTCSPTTPIEVILTARFQRLYGEKILTNNDIFTMLCSMQKPDGGWNENQSYGISSIPTTYAVLNFLLGFKKGTDIDVIRQQGGNYLLSLWEENLAKDGLAFKNAQCLMIMVEFSRRGLAPPDLVKQNTKETIEQLEKRQSSRGSWGSFYPTLGKCDLDVYLASTLMTAITTDAIAQSARVINNHEFVRRLSTIARKGIEFIASQQHEAGFWFADSGTCFLKTLGWGIKAYQGFLLSNRL